MTYSTNKRTISFWLTLAFLLALFAYAMVPRYSTSAQSAWAPGVTYATGALVTYNGIVYKCTSGHTSQTGWEPPNVPALWTVNSGGGTGPTATRTRTPTTGGTTCTLTAGIMTSSQFTTWFPSRHANYTWQNFCTAANAHYSAGFLNSSDSAMKKRELAAFLANISHETSFLVYIEEIAKTHDYCDNTQSYGCPAGEYAYFGRGAIQLSWNFNYYAAGNALGVGNGLLNTPSQVAGNNSYPFRTAIWYWMTQNGPGTMTAHNAIFNNQGFGQTIRSINGALECGKPVGSVEYNQMMARVNNYTGSNGGFNFLSKLGTTAVGTSTC